MEKVGKESKVKRGGREERGEGEGREGRLTYLQQALVLSLSFPHKVLPQEAVSDLVCQILFYF